MLAVTFYEFITTAIMFWLAYCVFFALRAMLPNQEHHHHYHDNTKNITVINQGKMSDITGGNKPEELPYETIDKSQNKRIKAPPRRRLN